MFDLHSSSRNIEKAAIAREAWRVRLHNELAAKAAQERKATAIQRTVLIGVVIGVIGCAALYLH